MSDKNLLNIIKCAAVEAVEVSKPSAVVIGTVKNHEPLEILIDQKMLIDEDFLILTDIVREHEVVVTTPEGEKTFLVKNTLKVGDSVILLRVQGGQRFVVLGRR